MARIPLAELERLKAEVSLERLAEARGVVLKRRGKELVGRCPFHEDDTPSLSISPEKNVWRCFGACNAGGDVLAWVMRAERVSLPHAVALLRADLPGISAEAAGAGPVRGKMPVSRSTVRKMPGLFAADAEDQELLGRVVDYYHQTLKASPEALGYLAKRGLESGEAVDRFRLGYANRTLGYRLPEKNRKEGARIRGRLIELGVLRESGHEHLAGSLVIPIFDASGQVVQLYGRKVTPNLRAGTAQHLYLPGGQRGVWNREGIRGASEVILCEALLDALTFWVAGHRNVTTAYGVNGMTPDLWEALREYGTKRVLIAFDRDEAGERAAVEVGKHLVGAGIEAYRIQFPKGMDANAYAAKVKPTERSLALVIRNAVWMGGGTDTRGRETRAKPVATGSAGEAVGTAAEEGRESALAAVETTSEREPEAAVVSPVSEASSGSEESVPATEEATASAEAPAAPLPPDPGSDLLSSAARPEAAGPSPTARPLVTSPEANPPAPVPAPAVVRIPTPLGLAPLERRGSDLWMHAGDRSYRVRGLEKNPVAEVLKVNVATYRGGVLRHVDTLDLYTARLRQLFGKQAAAEMAVDEEVVKKDLGRLVVALEAAKDEAGPGSRKPKTDGPVMSEAERTEALAFLRASDLLDQVLRDFARSGVVGEETNKLVGYLAAVSRKLEKPLAILIQSSTAAGKTSLMDAVLAFVPEEERLVASEVTSQALYYMQELGLRHKVLAVAEEEGAQRASYSLKLLQSDGKLLIFTTDKDLETGRHVATPYTVEGPVMLFLSTTRIEMDEELLNRCLVLTVDEGREQTRAIHRAQRKRQTLAGVLEQKEQARVIARHQNAQRLLRPLKVVNPYAEELTFVDHQTRCRRDHMKYLTMIQTLALLHQYQREVKTARTATGEEVAYIEVTREDLAVADRLMGEVLGHSLDELPPQTRRLLEGIQALVAERAEREGIEPCEVRFTRREVRERTGAGHTQTHIHLQRLEEMEYLLAYGGGSGQRRVYELVYTEPSPDSSSRSHVPTAHGYDGNRSGPFGGLSGRIRAAFGGHSGQPGSGESRTGSEMQAPAKDAKPESAPERVIAEGTEKDVAPASVVPPRRVNGS